MKRFLRAVSVALVALGPGVAGAQAQEESSSPSVGALPEDAEAARPEEPTAEARQEASDRFQKGLRFYEDGDYNLALIEFDRAYQLVPDYRVLYNIGQVAISLGRFARARVALEAYLAEGSGQLAEDRQEAVTRDLEMLKGRTALLVVQAMPEGAEVLVDDVSFGLAPLEKPLLLDAGEHRVLVKKPRHLPVNRRITLAGSEELTLEVILEPEQEEKSVVIVRESETPLQTPTLPVRDDPQTGLSPVVIGWTSTGILAGGAVVTGLMGLSARRELDELERQRDPSRSDADDAIARGERWFLATDILAASAAVAAGVSIYFMLSDSGAKREIATARQKKSLDLELRTAGSNVSLFGRF